MERLKKIGTFINKYIIPSASVILMVGVLYVSINRIQKPIIINKEQAAETIQGSTIGFSPTTISTIPGSSFDIQLIIDTKTETISAVDLFLTYDINILRANSISIGSFFPKVLNPGDVKDQAINIVLGCDPNMPKNGTGILATVNFTALSVGSAILTYTNDSQVASLGKNINSLVTSLTSIVNVYLPSTSTPIPPTITSLPPLSTITPIPTNTPTTINPTTSSNNSKIIIYAYGTRAKNQYPTMALLINDETKAIFYQVIDKIREFSFNSPTKIDISQIKVAFTNDYADSREDRNLRVDKIVVDGTTYQSENYYSIGTYGRYTLCKPGYKNSDWLHCKGHFDFSKQKIQ